MGYSELKYRDRFSTSVDKNILKAFKELAKKKKQPLSWLTDDALEDYLLKNNIKVEKAKKY